MIAYVTHEKDDHPRKSAYILPPHTPLTS